VPGGTTWPSGKETTTANNYISDISTSVCISGLLHSLLAYILFSYLSSG